MAIEDIDSEPGATDNRMSLSPADYPFIKDWEDGSSYTFDKVRVVQQSTGEFSITAAEPEEMEEEETGEPPESATPEEGVQTEEAPAAESEYENPAIANLMRRRRGA